MLALRENFLGDKAAVLIHRHRTTGDPDLVSIRHVVAAHADRAAAQADVVQAEAVLAIGGKQWLLIFTDRFVIGRRMAVNDPERLRTRFVEIAVLAVDAQDVGELVAGRLEFARLRRPLGVVLEVDVDDGERQRLERLAGAEYADLGPVDEVRVIRVHAEANR